MFLFSLDPQLQYDTEVKEVKKSFDAILTECKESMAAVSSL